MMPFKHEGRLRTELFSAGILLPVLAASVLLSGCGKEAGCNLVIITIDTLRADHLTCYGYPRPTSPRIDEFAERGVVFEEVACQSSQTLPSHASIFIGTNPRTHLAISHESVVDPSQTTLAEMLKQEGFTTAAFISSHALDSKLGLDQGFDQYWEVHKELTILERELQKAKEQDGTSEAVLAWLEANQARRFFLWIHWFYPHRPYDPPPRYLREFAGPYSGLADSEPEFVMKVWREQIDLSQEDVAYLTGCYDGEIAFTDFQVGRILDALSSMGLLEKTIVIITSDHGEMLYDHEYYFGHDIGLYDECIMIPLILYVPGLDPANRRIEQFVESVDILPTVLDLLDMDCPSYAEGRSLMPLVGGHDESSVAHAFSETFPFPEKCPPRHAVRTADSKLIWKQGGERAVTKEFYDLASDPMETLDLFFRNPPEAAHLDSVLTAWVKKGGLTPAPIPTAVESGRLRILKSLGYLD